MNPISNDVKLQHDLTLNEKSSPYRNELHFDYHNIKHKCFCIHKDSLAAFVTTIYFASVEELSQLPFRTLNFILVMTNNHHVINVK